MLRVLLIELAIFDRPNLANNQLSGKRRVPRSSNVQSPPRPTRPRPSLDSKMPSNAMVVGDVKEDAY